MPNAIVVVGGGVAGMTVALELLERASVSPDPPEVICLEASSRPGGNIRSESDSGYVLEWGPNGFLDNSPPTLHLVRRIGLSDRLLPSDAASAKRYIYRAGKLRKLPGGALSFLFSDVLTTGGKLSVFGEPFRKGKRDDVEESVYSFASRRIGEQAARVLVAAMVSGIYAGDAKNLSLQAAFPKMARMERDHGGLFRAMLSRKREKSPGGGGPSGPGGHLTSFDGGLQVLTDGLASALGPVLRLNTKVSAVGDMGIRGVRVLPESGAPIDAAAVVLACPSWHASELVAETDRELSEAIGAIPSASLAVVHLGYRNRDLPVPLDGFGYLAPRGEGLRILGTLWSSSIFPGNRAPDGHALVTSMIGGATDPEAVDLEDAALAQLVRADLEKTMRVERNPSFVRIFRHPRGIPQYTLGHMARLATIDRRLDEHPGLFVCGNSYRGISVNACVAEAATIADRAFAATKRFAVTPA